MLRLVLRVRKLVRMFARKRHSIVFALSMLMLPSCETVSPSQLELQLSRRITVAADIALSGVAFQQTGAANAWTRSGQVYEVGAGLSQIANLGIAEGEILSVARSPGGLRALSIRSGQAAILEPVGVTSIATLPSLREAVAAFDYTHWVVAGIVTGDTLIVAWVDSTGEVLNAYRTHKLRQSKDEPPPRAFLAAFRSRVALLSDGDSIRMHCFEDRALIAQSAAARSDLFGALDSGSSIVPAWTVASLVVLDSGYLATMTDLRSSARTLLTFDGTCKLVRARRIEQPMVPAGSDPRRRTLIAARNSATNELLEFSWRWGASVVSPTFK